MTTELGGKKKEEIREIRNAFRKIEDQNYYLAFNKARVRNIKYLKMHYENFMVLIQAQEESGGERGIPFFFFFLKPT